MTMIVDDDDDKAYEALNDNADDDDDDAGGLTHSHLLLLLLQHQPAGGALPHVIGLGRQVGFGHSQVDHRDHLWPACHTLINPQLVCSRVG